MGDAGADGRVVHAASAAGVRSDLARAADQVRAGHEVPDAGDDLEEPARPGETGGRGCGAAVKKLLSKFAGWLTRKTTPQTELLQLHLIGTACGKDFFQVAQRRFAIGAPAGEKLAWVSEMVGKCSIQKPLTEIYYEHEPRFIRISEFDRGWNGDPIFLTDRRAS